MDENKGQGQEAPQFKIDEQVVKDKIEALKGEQNLGMGMVGGAVGGLIGAVIWAIISYVTEYQIGWMAVGVGFLVGLGIRALGKGMDKVYGVLGGVIALLSVVLGNFLAAIGFLAKMLDVGYLDMLVSFRYSMTLELMKETFSVIDVLFYAIAVYEGYQFSFRKITKEELLEGAIMPADQG